MQPICRRGRRRRGKRRFTSRSTSGRSGDLPASPTSIVPFATTQGGAVAVAAGTEELFDVPPAIGLMEEPQLRPAQRHPSRLDRIG